MCLFQFSSKSLYRWLFKVSRIIVSLTDPLFENDLIFISPPYNLLLRFFENLLKITKNFSVYSENKKISSNEDTFI